MYVLSRGGSRRSVNIWPGFVDALATLLLVVIFVLMVFMVAQYFLTVALTGRDEALERLQRQVNDLAELLALERSANAELRIDVSQLSSELQSSLTERESLANQLAALTRSNEDLQARLSAAEAARDAATRELENAYKTVEADKEKIEAQLAQLAMLQRLRDEMAEKLRRSEEENRRVAKELEDAYKVIEADKEKIKAQLQDLAILQSLRDELMTKLAAAEGARDEQKKLTDEAQQQLMLLNRQIIALRQQLSRLAVALEAAEAEAKAKDVQIADLGRRLNVALASKVQELARYRSEFFGRLREVLGDRKDIRIVGDRFVFQSEVLFASGSAELGEEGKQQLAQLARTLKSIAAKIPKELNWILQVDGHTDRAPIHTPEFPSNWELSTARAISVVRFLIEQGIPPHRLAATGYGEFQPLDPGLSEEAFRRNRRIELKLTQR
ncbi:MAG: peptidoglycan -binding protein [Alphaproteobacteria bacterium]|nr:MAG: peptidoglycan -binding protein [Alphaproteobacteria bacterium]